MVVFGKYFIFFIFEVNVPLISGDQLLRNLCNNQMHLKITTFIVFPQTLINSKYTMDPLFQQYLIETFVEGYKNLSKSTKDIRNIKLLKVFAKNFVYCFTIFTQFKCPFHLLVCFLLFFHLYDAFKIDLKLFHKIEQTM